MQVINKITVVKRKEKSMTSHHMWKQTERQKLGTTVNAVKGKTLPLQSHINKKKKRFVCVRLYFAFHEINKAPRWETKGQPHCNPPLPFHNK